jgi:hypothetical protein
VESIRRKEKRTEGPAGDLWVPRSRISSAVRY